MSNRPRFRLFVDQDLALGPIGLGAQQSHYLANVMRAKAGEDVALFNGRQGEWRASLTRISKSQVEADITAQTRSQEPEPDIWLLAAPLKKDCTDLVAEKAAELGASALWPVMTARTNASRVNKDRLSAHLMEASEQSERLSVPRLFDPAPLDKVLADWDQSRVLIFLDESGLAPPLAQTLIDPPAKLAILVGPEGGFDDGERSRLNNLPFARPVGLGPRVLRAETAAIAALALVQALAGDWRQIRPR